uniref:DNA polymerase III polC-type n=1 Tax=Zeugodacus cucurbitae TaxID=28588 RepID=A0A0A1XKA6_ZEUCU
MSSYRPRRTRIYGANYDIGESSYKKLLESLDNKRGVGRSLDSHVPLARETSLPPKVTFLQDEDDFDREKYRASLRAKLQLDDDDADAFGSTLKQSKLRLAERSRYLDNEDEDVLGSTFKPLKFRGLDESSAAVESSLKITFK